MGPWMLFTAGSVWTSSCAGSSLPAEGMGMRSPSHRYNHRCPMAYRHAARTLTTYSHIVVQHVASACHHDLSNSFVRLRLRKLQLSRCKYIAPLGREAQQVHPQGWRDEVSSPKGAGRNCSSIRATCEGLSDLRSLLCCLPCFALHTQRKGQQVLM